MTFTLHPTREDPDEKARAERRALLQERKRARRDVLAAYVDVLDNFEPRVGVLATRDQVEALMGAEHSRTALRSVFRGHRAELLADGYDGPTDTFTRRAVLRVALLMRSDQARAIADAACRAHQAATADRDAAAVAGAQHVQRCRATLDTAFDVACRVTEEDPAEAWAFLSDMDRYGLQLVTVALAAMLSGDSSNGVTGWLASLPPLTSDRRSRLGRAAIGLSMLTPQPEAG